MNAPDWIPGFLRISPETAGAIGAAVLLLLIVLDVYASSDEIEGNTPREIAVRWTRWTGRVLGIPATGAPVPFGLGALMGHFFHPGFAPDLARGWSGLGIVVASAAVLAVLTGLLGWRIDRKSAWGLALLGLVAGAMLWPVSAALPP